jgi:hypothetical protein
MLGEIEHILIDVLPLTLNSAISGFVPSFSLPDSLKTLTDHMIHPSLPTILAFLHWPHPTTSNHLSIKMSSYFISCARLKWRLVIQYIQRWSNTSRES